MSVPEVLVSGNKAEIENWRRRQAIRRTIDRRPDLIANADIRSYIELYAAFILAGADEKPEPEKMREVSDLCGINGVIKNFLVSDGARFDKFKRVKGLEQVVELLNKKYDGKDPLIIDFTDSQGMDITDWADLKRNLLESDLPALFIYMIEPGFWKSNILALTLKKLGGAV